MIRGCAEALEASRTRIRRKDLDMQKMIFIQVRRSRLMFHQLQYLSRTMVFEIERLSPLRFPGQASCRERGDISGGKIEIFSITLPNASK
jgi:hypothetical protein